MMAWNPVAKPASWMTFEIQEALNAIAEPHSTKKRCTVLRLAEAKALGLSVTSVFELEDTCNQQTWYGRSTADPGWKDDPAIAEALELASRTAKEWQDRDLVQRITLRQRQLSLTQDELVDLSLLATQTLADLMMNANSEKVKLEAAETVLDRADEATARKLVAATDITLGERKGPSMADIRRRQRRRGGLAQMDVLEMEAEITTAVTATAVIPYEEAGPQDGNDFLKHLGDVEWVPAEDEVD